MMDMITLYLKLAFSQPGCPICRLRRESEQRYLFNLLWENVNDGPIRQHLAHSLGFCPEHAWALQATEQQQWHDGMGTGIIYEDLTGRALNVLNDYLKRHRPDRHRRRVWRIGLNRLRAWLEDRGSMGRRLARRLRLPTAPAASLLAHLSARQGCPACQVIDRSEETNLTWLARGLADPQFRGSYVGSDGLCLPHLRRALLRVEDEEAARFLVQTTADKLAPLLADLQEYGRKHIWQNRYEPRHPWEQASWVRAIAFFGGEAEQSWSESVYQVRRQALADYQHRPEKSPDGKIAT